jgi:FAD:protein FMN transferase
MTNLQKNALFSLLILALAAGVYFYRQLTATPATNAPADRGQLVVLAGEAMGSTYNIRYLDPANRNFKQPIDSLLADFNRSVSTYDPESDISVFNRGDSVQFRYPFFYPILQRSREVYELTGGAFDPTVGPLVVGWGFGPKKGLPDELPNVDSLRQLVDFPSLRFDARGLRKTRPGIYLDLNAIAPGYGVDLVANYLRSQGLAHFMVEIGGEVVCQGLNDQEKVWTIGINNPVYEEKGGEYMQAALQVKDQGLATSGNYRRYYIKDGKRYAHTIDPKTGRPVEHNLLSATVLAKDCMTADALATAFMVMGKDKAVAFSQQHQVEVFLIYDANGKLETYTSESLKAAFVQ